MRINDSTLEHAAQNKTIFNRDSLNYRIVKNSIGNCDGCYFCNLAENPNASCPGWAVTICCSNGGNIIEEVKPNNK